MAAGTVIRLGFGEISVPFETTALARQLFLCTAESLYSAIKDDLIALAPSFVESPFGFEPEVEAVGAIGHWCRTWKLVTGKSQKPAEWALKVAYESLASYSDTVNFGEPDFIWVVTCGGAVPDCRADDYQSRLRTSTLKELKRRTSRRPELSEGLSGAKSAGWHISPTIRNPEHVAWAVDYSIKGLTYKQIADKYFNNPLDPIETARNIRDQVSSFRKAMDWRAPSGRRPAR